LGFGKAIEFHVFFNSCSQLDSAIENDRALERNATETVRTTGSKTIVETS
jgi:hypothetical protein